MDPKALKCPVLTSVPYNDASIAQQGCNEPLFSMHHSLSPFLYSITLSTFPIAIVLPETDVECIYLSPAICKLIANDGTCIDSNSPIN